MSAVQNDTLKINHYVNRAAPVSIYRDWPASLLDTWHGHGIKPVRLNVSFDSKCTRPETSHSYQSFTILINTSTGIIVDLNNLSFKWHNNSRHQTIVEIISQKMSLACRQHNHMFTKVVTPSVNAHSNISLKWMDFRSATLTHMIWQRQCIKIKQPLHAACFSGKRAKQLVLIGPSRIFYSRSYHWFTNIMWQAEIQVE